MAKFSQRWKQANLAIFILADLSFTKGKLKLQTWLVYYETEVKYEILELARKKREEAESFREGEVEAKAEIEKEHKNSKTPVS